MFWTKLLMVILAGFLIWWIFRMIRGNPKAFSWESLHKSFFTMGILALILIGFIALMVMYLKHT